MQWVRLDTAFPRNHKVLALLGMRDGHKALVTYVCGLAYAGEQVNDGFIPRNALPFLHGRLTDAVKLVEVGLWHDDQGGWLVNDWDEYQPTSETTARRSMLARSAARSRWEKDAARKADGNAKRIAPASDSRTARTNARTDVRTNVLSPTEEISPSSDARTRALNDSSAAPRKAAAS